MRQRCESLSIANDWYRRGPVAASLVRSRLGRYSHGSSTRGHRYLRRSCRNRPWSPHHAGALGRDLRLNPFYTVRAVLAARGLIRFTPPPRALLRGKPVWQLLHEASVDTAVVRFRFTYPPEGQESIVVSDWVGHDQWESLGVKREPTPDTVTPRALAVELLAPFRSAEPSDPTLFTRLLPGPTPPKPADSLLDPIQELRIASDIDNRTWEVSEAILRRKPTQSFLAVYIGGLDSVEHAFWPYRFPGDFPVDSPAQADIERLGPVLDRYVTYFDQRLNRRFALDQQRRTS